MFAWCLGKVIAWDCHALLLLKVTRCVCLTPSAKLYVTHFENPVKQVIQKYGHWEIRMDAWDSFTKLYAGKHLIRAIQIKTMRWIVREEAVQSKSPCPFSQLLLRLFLSSYLKINPFSRLNIHISASPVSLDFLSVLQVVLRLKLIKGDWWPSKLVKHGNIWQTPPSEEFEPTANSPELILKLTES